MGWLLAGGSARSVCSSEGRLPFGYPTKPWQERPAVWERRWRRVMRETSGRVLGVEIQESWSALKYWVIGASTSSVPCWHNLMTARAVIGLDMLQAWNRVSLLKVFDCCSGAALVLCCAVP